MEHSIGLCSQLNLIVVPPNIRLGGKLKVHTSLPQYEINYDLKKFNGAGANVTKRFTTIIYKFS